MLPASVDTLAGVGRGPGLVHLRDRRRSLTLLAWPRGRSRAGFGQRGKLRSRELPGRRWELRIRGQRRITYRVRASMSALKRKLRPCAVAVDGRPLSRRAWDFEPKRGILSARLKAKRARVVVDGRC